VMQIIPSFGMGQLAIAIRACMPATGGLLNVDMMFRFCTTWASRPSQWSTTC
jgi:hypothetical protein